MSRRAYPREAYPGQPDTAQIQQDFYSQPLNSQYPTFPQQQPSQQQLSPGLTVFDPAAHRQIAPPPQIAPPQTSAPPPTFPSPSSSTLSPTFPSGSDGLSIYPQQNVPFQPPVPNIPPPPVGGAPSIHPPTGQMSNINQGDQVNYTPQLSNFRPSGPPPMSMQQTSGSPQGGFPPPVQQPQQFGDEEGFSNQFQQMSLNQPSGPPQQFGGSYPATSAGVQQGWGQPSHFTPPPQQQEVILPPNPEAQCPPEFMKMTMSVVPESQGLLSRAGVPFGAILHPLAETTDYKIPVVNAGSVGIVRCRKCRAYINPFVQFIEGGRRWRCNICSLPNEVPMEYFRELDANGQRVDRLERPELSSGCVEFIAPAEYMVRRPMPPTYLFVIDVSYYSVSSGMLKTCVEAIKDSLDGLPDKTRSNVGFITFDSSVHFYSLNSALSQPRMLVVPDVDEMFLPMPDDLVVNLKESRDSVDGLLSKLANMHVNTTETENAAGAALRAGYEVLRQVGGKLMFFLSKLPTKGEAILKMREDPKLLGTDKEVLLLRSQNKFYKDFALECSKQQISIDCFLFSPHYTDVATLEQMPQVTGGELHHYPAFTTSKDGVRFACDLKSLLTSQTGWEAVIRARITTGVKITQHYGNFLIKNSDLLSLPSVDSRKAFGVQLSIDAPLTGIKYVSLQNALLYTTSWGERRIRVCTVCLPVTSSMSDLFKFADVDAVTALTAKMACDKAINSKLSDARQALLNKCIDILTTYRNTFATPQTSPTQLLLPDTLKLYPLYTLALIKHVAFKSGAEAGSDERSYALALLRTLPIHLVIPLIYPRLYALRGMPGEFGTVGPNGKILLPPVNNLINQKVDRSGIYLLDNGQYLLLWVGKAAPPDLLQQVFGVSSLYTVDDSQLKLTLQNNEVSKQIMAVVDGVRQQNGSYQNLYVIREGDMLEQKFFGNFVEDRTKNLPSYYEFLVSLQKKVQEKGK